MVEEKILVVDDNEEILDKTKELLERVGYSVVCCNSGKDALAFLSENKVDLVLLDINMPNMNGFDVCLRIRQRHALDDLPVIFLTNLSDKETVKSVMPLKPEGYLLKSINSAVLRSELEKFFNGESLT